MAHHRYPPSSAARTVVCPGWVAVADAAYASGLAEPDTAGPAAREGTVAMAVLETYLRAEEPMTLEQAAFHAVLQHPCEPEPFEISGEMLATLERALPFFIQPRTQSRTWGVEHRLDIERAGTEGTCDFWAYGGHLERLTVIDYKHGAGVHVDPQGNWQLALYACGVVDYLKLLDGARIDCLIVQPRHIAWSPNNCTWETTAGEVRRMAEAHREAQKSSALRAGDHCKFCPGALACPARHAEVFASDEAIEHQVADLSDEAMAGLLGMEARVTSFFRDLKHAAIGRIQGGRSLPGWTVAEGRGSYDWRLGAEKALAERLGEEAYEKRLLTPAQIRDNAPDGDEIFKEWAFRKAGAPTLKKGAAKPEPINWPKGTEQ
jgi:hypothetical protein